MPGVDGHMRDELSAVTFGVRCMETRDRDGCIALTGKANGLPRNNAGGDVRRTIGHARGHLRAELIHGGVLNRQHEARIVFIDHLIQQVAQQSMGAIVGAQVGLMEHPRIHFAIEHIVDQDVTFLIQHFRIGQVASPEAGIEAVVFFDPLFRVGDVVIKVIRAARNFQNRRLILIVDTDVR